jgi:hypothetical protein
MMRHGEMPPRQRLLVMADAIFREHADEILNILRKQEKLSPADAEDVMFAVFERKLLPFLARGGSLSDPRGWLALAARRLAVEYRGGWAKRNIDHLEAVPSTIDSTAHTASSIATLNEALAKMKEVTARLPEQDRLVLELRSDDRPWAEIGASVGLDADAARKRYAAVRRVVLDQMGQTWSSLFEIKTGAERAPQTREAMLKALDVLGEPYATLLRARYDAGEKNEWRLAEIAGTDPDDAKRVIARADELLELRFGLTPDLLRTILGRA